MEYYATGMMSGTSLDGTDLCYCSFSPEEGKGDWKYRIQQATTIPYPEDWKEQLRNAPGLQGRELIALHMAYGKYLGQVAYDFFLRHQIKNPGVLASHGHTIYHRPDLGYTFQLGHGAAIASIAQTTVVSDFRSMDVSMGGQGAPLVPLGDKLLFGQYTYCLNLGGFANVSFEDQNQRLAFDICPFNFVINRLVREAHIPKAGYMINKGSKEDPRFLTYDPEGQIARKGQTDHKLLEQLNGLPFYQLAGPKSLGEEWVNADLWPLLERSNLPLEDKLHTFYEHAAQQLLSCLKPVPGDTLLVTGGGSHNRYFIECLGRHNSNLTIVLPDQQTIDFKEALVFALLGLKCIQKEDNCLASATGASIDNIGGSIHYF